MDADEAEKGAFHKRLPASLPQVDGGGNKYTYCGISFFVTAECEYDMLKPVCLV